jgi:hypothetical protein
MLTQTQAATLKTFILATPALAAMVSVAEGGTSTGGTQDQTLTDAVNAMPGGAIAVTSLSLHDFTLATLPMQFALADASVLIQSKWDRILRAVLANDPISITNPNVQAAFGIAIGDGLLTGPQAAAMAQRAATQPEAMFGSGVVLTSTDISFAMRGAK